MHFLAKSFSADSQVISPAGKAIIAIGARTAQTMAWGPQVEPALAATTAFRSGKTQIFNWVDGVIL